MLSVHDCVAFSGLTVDQLDAVALHEGLSPVLAAEWAECMLERPEGCRVIANAIAAAAHRARVNGHHRRAARFEESLSAFRSTNPS